MNARLQSTLATAILVFCAGYVCAGEGKSSLVGGYSAASVTNEQVVAAAAFAVEAQQAVLRTGTNSVPAKLALNSIMQAEQQVVAGMNFRLQLKVTLDGKERVARAVVWWQSWRSPNPYQLTSWSWE
jgi:broad specificity polyphosphatase/5'/3'-nucleotidase SurE